MPRKSCPHDRLAIDRDSGRQRLAGGRLRQLYDGLCLDCGDRSTYGSPENDEVATHDPEELNGWTLRRVGADPRP